LKPELVMTGLYKAKIIAHAIHVYHLPSDIMG
jgi:hypothetical protein